jgi:hypothetical protein
MLNVLKAIDIKKNCALTIPPFGKRCHIIINERNKIELVWKSASRNLPGIVWLFVCPVSGTYCRQLNLYKGKYVHRSTIKEYRRLSKPLWKSGTLLDKVLVRMQRKIDAENAITAPFFKKYYNGNVTKRYKRLLGHIDAAEGLTTFNLINGIYDNKTILQSL